jgi:transketolase
MEDRIDLREIMVQAFISAVEEGINLVVLVCDSTSTSKIAPFKKRFPERVIDVGIAEQNMVGVAVGLSLGGYVTVTANASCFLVARANEQVKNDVCYSEANVKLVGLNAGVSYGPLAATHHAINDISTIRGMGNIIILAPSDPVETEQIFRFALQHKGSIYIRMDNARFPRLHHNDYRFSLGKVDVLRDGNEVSLISVGSVVHEAYAAALELEKESLSIEVLNVSSIRPLDNTRIIESIKKTKRVVTVEEHSVHGGLGSLIAEIMADEGLQAKLVRLGMPEGEFAKYGPREEIRAYYKIDSTGIIDTVHELMSTTES